MTASLVLGIVLSSPAIAQVVIPGSADVGRVKPEEKPAVPDRSRDAEVAIPVMPVTEAPPGAKEIHFVLHKVIVEGATAPLRLEDIYAPYIGKEITLDVVWMIAGSITERYRNAGYFLSRAYVPQQSIKDGRIVIKVVEGYIGQVALPDDWPGRRPVRGYIARLLKQKPVTADAVESFLLRMNDLPGTSFRAVMSPLGEGAPEGAVKLILEPAAKDGKGSITFDNFSSRFLGPNELSAAYSTSFLPLQQTSVSLLSSLPGDKLRYGTLGHSIALAPDLTLELGGAVTKAFPGYTLKAYDIDSLAISETVALNYQWVRQRQENLSLKLSFDRRDTSSDILNAPLTRDHVRALRLNATYDASDDWRGYNIVTTTLSRGISGLGASDKDDRNLSRAGALPDFTKMELSASRLQAIADEWQLYASAAGQWASGVLYSSEQFGYGGQSFGRAYDTSDITGDHGASGALELRYSGWSALQPVSLQPYAFYDAGIVWNEAVGQAPRLSGASAGLGLRFSTRWHQTGNLGLAWPLTRRINTPIYGMGHEGPRILLQTGQEF